jgi:hypothetical protein
VKKKISRISNFKDSKFQEFQIPKISKISDFKDFRFQIPKIPKISDFKDFRFQIPKIPNSKFEILGIWNLKFLEFGILGI